ncbi:MAG: hypothetical protein ACOC8F_03480 [Planctomycetota bacterium]
MNDTARPGGRGVARAVAGVLARPAVALPVVALPVVALVAAVLLVVVWAVHRPIGDLYVAYAGGRDVVEGKLGGPDDWAFNTDGRTWYNQNWGTHLLYYLTYTRAGETGILVLKMALLAATAGFIVLAGRRRGAETPPALLVAAGVLLASHSYIDLRPNLVTLVLTPLMLWLLYRSGDRQHRVWWALPVAAAWANMHGGFVFGLGLMGLWALCLLIEAVVRTAAAPRAAEAAGLTPRRWWAPVAAAGAAVVLSGTLTPFGLDNLTHPFVVGGSETWRSVDEWQPVWRTDVGFGTVKELLIFLGIFAAVVAVNVVRRHAGAHRPARRGHKRKIRPIAPAAFDVLLATVVAAMAVTSRRFIPLAMIAMAPMLARQLTRFQQRLDARWLTVPLAAALLAPAAVLAREHLRYYDPDNPLYPASTRSIYARMMHEHRYAPGAAEFLRRNDIAGRTFHEWRWEGFLHWQCPGLELYVGGRAQQVHGERDDRIRRAILAGGPGAAKLLERLGVEVVVVPPGPPHVPLLTDNAPAGTHSRLLKVLLRDINSPWVVVYFSPRGIVVVNTGTPRGADWARRAAGGELWYPDERTAAWSRAMSASSARLSDTPEQALAACRRGAQAGPVDWCYVRALQVAEQRRLPTARVLSFYENELERITALGAEGHRRRRILIAQVGVCRTLFTAYRRLLATEAFARANPQRAAAMREKLPAVEAASDRASRQFQQMRKRWR